MTGSDGNRRSGEESRGIGGKAVTPLPGNAPRYNLRDYGGYAIDGGSRLRSGLLFRSGQLDEALPAEQGLLTNLGIDAVIDLRSANEIGEPSSPAYAGYGGRILVAECEDGVIPHALESLVRLEHADQVAQKMIHTYRLLPQSERFRQAMALYLDAVANGEGATLIHCFAGKDRTGLAVALLHLAMGVHGDDVYADYMLTNEAGEERIALGMAALRRQASVPVRDDILREAMAVREEYLAAALETIGAASKSPAAWLLQATGLDEGTLGKIRRRLVG